SSSAPGWPPAGTAPSNRVSQNLAMRLTKLPSTSARSRFTEAWKISQVNEVSECSGELAVRYQRQQSAGSSSSATSMKTPRFSDVENLSPYQLSQLNALRTSTLFQGSPEPRMVAGKLTVWKATLSFPMNST